MGLRASGRAASTLTTASLACVIFAGIFGLPCGWLAPLRRLVFGEISGIRLYTTDAMKKGGTHFMCIHFTDAHSASAIWARHLNPMQLCTHSHYTIRLRVCRVAPPFNIRSSNDLSRRTSDERHSLFHDCRILRSGNICHKILEVESDE